MKRVVHILLFALISLCAVAQQAQKPRTAKPQSGDGIGSFLLRNGYNIEIYTQPFIELNKKRLGKNNTLLMGVSYTLPDRNDSVEEPLFGKANKTVKITSRELVGATYYLVSGHGGPDPGATGRYNNHDLHEDEYAYDITLRLARQLMQRGAKVHIVIQDPYDGIRDEAYLKYDNDETCMGETIPLDQNERLKQRSIAVNMLDRKAGKGYRRSIFMHLDSRSKKEQIDIFLYHARNSSKGKRLAQSLLDRLKKKYAEHQPKRGFTGTVSERNLYVLKETAPPAVFLELGNIQNWRDQQRFIKASNREAVAQWLAEGLVDDYKKERR